MSKFKEGMFVRVPFDYEDNDNPRIFACGKIVGRNELKETITVKIMDPRHVSGGDTFDDYSLNSATREYPESRAERCTLFPGSPVYYKNKECLVDGKQKNDDGFYDYYIHLKNGGKIHKISEVALDAGVENGLINPAQQLINYEFQNPVWYVSYCIVSRSMNILDNSLSGLKELAGAKIYLFPHQLKTVMEIIQEEPFRFLLADEVGLGKTIEALSVLRILLNRVSNKRVLLIVPEGLKSQWTSEMLLKFDIPMENLETKNTICIKSVDELVLTDYLTNWELVIADEVHRLLEDGKSYENLRRILDKAVNVLLLSATPVSRRNNEYERLLKLLNPERFSHLTSEEFNQLLSVQSRLVENISLVLDDIEEYDELILKLLKEEEDPGSDDEAEEMLEEIVDSLEEIWNMVKDPKLRVVLDRISLDQDDYGIGDLNLFTGSLIKNYQLETNFIRNRRKLLPYECEYIALPVRKLDEQAYLDLLNDRSKETDVYSEFIDLLKELQEAGISLTGSELIRLLNSFFSSPMAFAGRLQELEKKAGNAADWSSLHKFLREWDAQEHKLLENLVDVIDDPEEYPELTCSRTFCIMDFLTQIRLDEKAVLFTANPETFEWYQKVLGEYFDPEELAFYTKEMNELDRDFSTYRFQTNKNCRIFLSDESGGEGRNLQCADYIVHIDLPWEAIMLEQRIGRLDRLDRNGLRPDVHSVVIHTSNSIEEDLFRIWHQGLNIFQESLSGMEIIADELQDIIVSAIQEDFQYGLAQHLPEIMELSGKLRSEIKKEQRFDTKGAMYAPLFNQVKESVEYYNDNDDELFSTAMMNWASLAGFNGSSAGMGKVRFSPYTFSIRSAQKAMLAMPEWQNYLKNQQICLLERMEQMSQGILPAASGTTANQIKDRSIVGTFYREIAIENEYIRFFAPGDELFDCITQNALQSCKGHAAAFQMSSTINWEGFFFTWKLEPRADIMLENNVPLQLLNNYRNYICSDQVVIPVSTENPDNLSTAEILEAYEKVISSGKKVRTTAVHFGKRGRSRQIGFEEEVCSNLTRFQREHPKKQWSESVTEAYQSSKKQAMEYFKRKSQILDMKADIEQVLSASTWRANLYDLKTENIKSITDNLSLTFQALSKSTAALESAAYIKFTKLEQDED